jgi:hypothetical protein
VRVIAEGQPGKGRDATGVSLFIAGVEALADRSAAPGAGAVLPDGD